MDEIAVPISWFRQTEDPDQLAVDTVCVRDSEISSTDPSLESSKTSPAVAVYLLQFYPVTQACVQPCVAANGQLTNASVLPQVSLSQPVSDGPCFVSQPSQTCSPIQNDVKEQSQLSSTYQDSIAPTLKWKQADAGEQPITVISRATHDVVHMPTAKHVTQISAGTLSVCTVRNNNNNNINNNNNNNTMNSVEPVRSTEHSVRTQPGEKPYSCNLCGKVFARAHNLKAHSQTHSGALPFACKICRKSYSQGAYYRIHSEILSGGRPYTCDVCSKVFCNSRSFNFHIRSHSRRKCIA